MIGTDGPVIVLVGGGDRAAADATVLRDCAAHFARAIPSQRRLGIVIPDTTTRLDDMVVALIEGAALARYVYRIGEDGPDARLTALALLCDPEAEAEAAVARGLLLVKATKLARDLAGTPGGMLTATRLGEVALDLGPGAGLEVRVFGEEELVELGCGGLLGINLGSVEPPTMIKLVYRPEGEPVGKLALVGKGIMYDAGGLALKPGDEVHAVMKNDMAGAGAILAAMTVLKDLGCRAQVTGYLMCTDNMPSARRSASATSS
nr:leucyl aminopeptidase family protein [Tessaracoccus coleopterorum]